MNCPDAGTGSIHSTCEEISGIWLQEVCLIHLTRNPVLGPVSNQETALLIGVRLKGLVTHCLVFEPKPSPLLSSQCLSLFLSPLTPLTPKSWILVCLKCTPMSSRTPLCRCVPPVHPCVYMCAFVHQRDSSVPMRTLVSLGYRLCAPMSPSVPLCANKNPVCPCSPQVLWLVQMLLCQLLDSQQ